MDIKTKHLELIQGVINRMAHNSFLLKGWSVVLVSALFALAAKDSKIALIPIAYLPAIAFWILDGYFLRQERLFRKLYDAVRILENSDIDFSMDTSRFSTAVDSWKIVSFSNTLRIFHGSIIISITIVLIVLLNLPG